MSHRIGFGVLAPRRIGTWRLGFGEWPVQQVLVFFPFILNENYNHNHEKQDIGVRQKHTHSDENGREHEEDIRPRQRRVTKNPKMKMHVELRKVHSGEINRKQ